jgi:hypothetical protein
VVERAHPLVVSFVDVDAVESEAGAERVHHRVVAVDDGGDPAIRPSLPSQWSVLPPSTPT